jgi:hypothetical protein
VTCQLLLLGKLIFLCFYFFSNSQGKIIYAKQNQIFSFNLKTIQSEAKDGDLIDIQPKNLGTTELFPNVKQYFKNKRISNSLLMEDIFQL